MKRLDDTEYNFKIPDKNAKGNKRKTSKEHSRARKILKELYPNLGIYEEIPIEIDQETQLYLDFYIPSLNTAIEVHGKQHYEYNSFHFKNKLSWLKAQGNDKKKIEWCQLNNIVIIILPYNLDDQAWKNLLI